MAVPSPAGLVMRRSPPTEATRSASSVRPWPAGFAPPGPSSRTSTVRNPGPASPAAVGSPSGPSTLAMVTLIAASGPAYLIALPTAAVTTKYATRSTSGSARRSATSTWMAE